MEEPLKLSFENTANAFEHKSTGNLRKANLLFSAMGSPWFVNMGAVLTNVAFKLHLPVKGLIKNTIFNQFCGGENLEEAVAASKQLLPFQVGVVLDYGVEAMEGEHNYDAAVPEFIRAIQTAAQLPNVPFIALKLTGFARFSLLEKIHDNQALTPDEQAEYDRVKKRIHTICQAASDVGVCVLIDAEESWIQQPVDDLAEEMMAQFNQGKVTVFNTYQLYRHDRYAFMQGVFERAQKAGYVPGMKLVRGAYMEKERKRAAELGVPSPIQPNKEATDRDYNAALTYCLDRLEQLGLFIGTHNEDSCMLAAVRLHEKSLQHYKEQVHFSQLFGMSDNITFNLAHAGYRVSKYLPYGPVKDVLPYLIRRAQENTSIAGQTGRELALIQTELKRRRNK